jgi:putative hydrolases of HD superfamily
MTSSNDDRADSLLRLLWRAERLEAFPRTGWQVCGVSDPESVAAHSYGVAVVALWLADHVDAPVNTEKVLRIALIHDLPEAMLTDLPRPVKERLGKKACRAAEAEAAAEIFEPHLSRWRENHDEYVAAQSIEARLVKSADKIQMLAKALQYHVEHRGRTGRFFADRSRYDDYGIELIAGIYDRLFQSFEEGQWFCAGFS